METALSAEPRPRGQWLDGEHAGFPPPEEPALDHAGEGAAEAVTGAQQTTPMWTLLVGVVALGVFLVGLTIGALSGDSNILGGVIVTPFLIAIVAFFARMLSRADGRPEEFSIVLAGFLVKCLGTLLRYWVAFSVYGSSDAAGYDLYGRLFARELRQGQVPSGYRWAGTNFIRLLSGSVYTIGPTSKIAGFLVFGFMSYLGTLAMWRAFRRGISPTDDRRYLLMLLLMPSLVYWPSAMGKEAFMMLCGGVASLGASMILTRRSLTGVPVLALGLTGISFVRPHVGLVVFSGLALASIVRSHKGSNPIAVLVGIVALVGAGLLVVNQATEFFGIETFSREAIEEQLDEASERTSQGGSEFTPIRVSTPVDLPAATATILFRPFPFEVGGPQELASAFEGVLLMGLTFASRRRIMTALRAMRRLPYAAYCAGGLLTFIVAFSAFSNFGILARQRTQVLPLFLALLAFPLPKPEPRPDSPAEVYAGPAKPRSPSWNPSP